MANDEDTSDKIYKINEKQTDLVERLARIEENEKQLNTRMEDLKESLSEEIQQTGVSKRVDDIMMLVKNQQQTEAKIIELQGKQGEQINDINKTLIQLEGIEKTIDRLDGRLTQLESKSKTAAEYRKEQIHGRWAVAAAIVAALSSIICSIIATVLR
jgi:chromosome segregation ATPase